MSVSARMGESAPAGGLGLRGRNYARQYWPFVVPAGFIVAAVIVFPWVFTLYMSVHEWHIGGGVTWAGLANYQRLLTDDRFQYAVLRTLYFTSLAVLLPMVLGIAAAVCFHRNFPLRGIARTIFILPMMATPVAIALVWTMMFHPQLGVLNYLLTSVGLPPSSWSYDASTVIPTLVLVETWQWTPLVMLIVLGGLASLPTDPYEAARLDGASGWQMFRHISLPLVWPHIIVALVIRTIDALKAFDLIFVISNGGPGTASETLNIYLYLEAFSFYDMGYASALVVVFFVIILLISLVLFGMRQRAY
ncbi:carbohydrate ABC transporter permease [Limobrevibacterium gyesilva]|uniref:Sugar ABC transporter permease n=1 Tax=Limobrevibacterium gyesilva TaxID=2991712 RepID=A0AA41YNN3_9PROT|nr:sugar ABC transporter permease [Limobrevibacterium gyesilva]MCW3477254.1 sugar ABC transporter permease [Limobrevibacterium gyesilva]